MPCFESQIWCSGAAVNDVARQMNALQYTEYCSTRCDKYTEGNANVSMTCLRCQRVCAAVPAGTWELPNPPSCLA